MADDVGSQLTSEKTSRVDAAARTPTSFDAEHIAEAREEVISCFRPLSYDDVVVGQYEGYRNTEGVRKNSRTEAFVAARLWVDNDRWHDVPFFLRTGKCMAASHQRVGIRFKKPAETLPGMPCDCNTLSFELSGDGEIALSLVAKEPGPTMALAAGSAVLPLGAALGSSGLPAYARLIHDVLLGDRSLFTRPDGLHHVWEVAADLLVRKPYLIVYPPASWGPVEARALAGDSDWVLGE